MNDLTDASDENLERWGNALCEDMKTHEQRLRDCVAAYNKLADETRRRAEMARRKLAAESSQSADSQVNES